MKHKLYGFFQKSSLIVLFSTICSGTQSLAAGTAAQISDEYGCNVAGDIEQPSPVRCQISTTCNADGSVKTCSMSNAAGLVVNCNNAAFQESNGNLCAPKFPNSPAPTFSSRRISNCYSGSEGFTLRVTDLKGGGSVSSSAGLIDCPAGFCSDVYRPGKKVTLIASPNPGYSVVGWTTTPADPGCPASSTSNCTVTMKLSTQGKPVFCARSGIGSLGRGVVTGLVIGSVVGAADSAFGREEFKGDREMNIKAGLFGAAGVMAPNMALGLADRIQNTINPRPVKLVGPPSKWSNAEIEALSNHQRRWREIRLEENEARFNLPEARCPTDPLPLGTSRRTVEIR